MRLMLLQRAHKGLPWQKAMGIVFSYEDEGSSLMPSVN